MNTGGGWTDKDRIAEIRKERGLTITALAKLIGIERGSLNNIEQGHRGASLGMLQKIADGLGVPLLEIVKPGTSLHEALTRDNGNGNAA